MRAVAYRGNTVVRSWLDRGLCMMMGAGLLLVLVWPAARGSHEWVGWLPLWLVGMPAAAWWALHLFPLPVHWFYRLWRAYRMRVHKGKEVVLWSLHQ